MSNILYIFVHIYNRNKMETKIYTLSSSENPNIIRYIGKTNGSLKKRLSGHITLAKINLEKKYGHNYTSNWINKELSSGNYIIIEELDLIIQDNWEYLERYWISQFKSWGFKLTNLTDGGDGNKGQFFSKESNIARGNKLRGIPRSEDVRKNISIGSTGKVLTDKHKENVRSSIIELQGKKIIQFTINGEFVKEWRCGADAARFFSVDKSSIMRCCQGKFKQSAGFVWKYKEEEIVSTHGNMKENSLAK